MLNHFAILLTAIAGAKLATADVVPTGPGPADVYRVGGPCKINWNTDASGAWNNFSITLKTGANLNMIALETVAEGLDGTTGTGEYEWTCPDVSPNSKIYFYEFAQPGETTSWTTRFTIAAADGSTARSSPFVVPQRVAHVRPPLQTDPTNETDGIPWGIGKLASGSSASSGNAASGSASSSLASSSSSSSSSSSISSASFSAASSASSTSSAESVVATNSVTLASATDNSNVVTVTSPVSSGFSSVVSRGSSAVSSAVVRASSSVDQDSGAGKVGAGLAMGLVGAAVALFA
ncbi:hypothetical protein JCM11641_003134 [Rhodosporidiobolus odoratus]